jgi:sugar phosphate isomerase/epimerase
MRDLRDRETGVIFWAGRDDLATVQSFGVRCGQLGVPGGMALDAAAAARWRTALEESAFTVVTVVAAYLGEDYADIPTVQRTVGFIPPGFRAQREQRTYAVSDFAASLGVKSVACHIGFVPEDASEPDYIAVRGMVRRICDYASRHGQTFALETGQEPAHVLLNFLKDVARPNLGINFDPANMILYGSGDPIEALGLLGPHVLSVHCKDGDAPAKDAPGSLGSERPLGEGSVGIPRFVGKLKEIAFRGPLNIERETENQEERYRDIRAAVKLLDSLT